MGLIAGLIVADPENPQGMIYTNHLNSVQILDNSHTPVDIQACLQHMNGHSYYHWMISLSRSSLIHPEYTKGHAETTLVPSILNHNADHYASRAQHNISSIIESPIPTFFMDPFIFFTPADGWIESNIRSFTDHSLARLTLHKLEGKPNFRMLRSLNNPTPPPNYPYLQAISSYSAMTQLYSWAGQLPTAARLLACNMMLSDICRFCHNNIKNEHHLFTECSHFIQYHLNVLMILNPETHTKPNRKGFKCFNMSLRKGVRWY
jgi:hypothetical protein